MEGRGGCQQPTGGSRPAAHGTKVQLIGTGMSDNVIACLCAWDRPAVRRPGHDRPQSSRALDPDGATRRSARRL